ncbi:acyltransferase family protein [Pelosinus sp. UFO1]|uniref:acyltransferase family protein n=1 Tax=Pelosinus sp. UFO1 TaxID=484770 RepID=UPI0004D19EA0|nr:acyltransferase family protein [Pelosinus sp. UFO1]AIF50828.1 acyltransferase 3 [Pelosinus sp. UFO1]
MAKQSSTGQENLINRMYFLDNLRSLIILLVVAYHAALAYMVRGPQWYYVIDPQNDFFFNLFVIFNDVFVMPVMFLLAGFFAIRSLTRKGQLVFWQGKILRIVIPYFAGIIFLAPAINYIYFLSRFDTPPAYLDYWVNIFFDLARQHAHLWFLGVLILFYLVLSLVYYFYKPLVSGEVKTSLPSIKFIIGFGLVTSIAFFGVKQFFDDYTWIMVKHVLMFQPTRCILYSFYFALGIYAYHQQWFTACGYMPGIKIWGPIAIVLGSIYTQFRIMFWAKRELLIVMIANDLLYSFFCLSAVFALVALFYRWMNYTSNMLNKLATNSYGIYFVHQPILMLLILAIRGYQINVFVKFLVVSVLTIALCIFVCEFILSKIPSLIYRARPHILSK